MTAETTGALPWPDHGSHGVWRSVRPVVGVLADGTPYYAPVGEIASDGTTVTCHLCGRSLKSVAAHLRVHGWTKAAYCETFGLERGQSLEGRETRKRRAASFAPRLIFDPAIRAGSAAGRPRAPAGAPPPRRARPRPRPPAPAATPPQGVPGRNRCVQRGDGPGQPGTGGPAPGRGGRPGGQRAGLSHPGGVRDGPGCLGSQLGRDQPGSRAEQGLAAPPPGRSGPGRRGGNPANAGRGGRSPRAGGKDTTGIYPERQNNPRT